MWMTSPRARPLPPLPPLPLFTTASLIAQRLRRVDGRGPAGREVGGEQADDAEHRRRGDADAGGQRRLSEELERLVPLDRQEAQQRSEEHTSELQSLRHLVCRLL